MKCNGVLFSANELEEKTCLLHLLDDKTFKSKWLQQLSTQVAEAKNITTDKILKKVTPSDLIVRNNEALYHLYSNYSILLGVVITVTFTSQC